MYRRFLKSFTRDLLELASKNPSNASLLQEIEAELAERVKTDALFARIEVGKLLQSAKDKAMRDSLVRKRADQLRRLSQKLDGLFEWPVTDAPASSFGISGDHFFFKEGLLKYVGYSVGLKGETVNMRQQILDCVFHNELPKVQSLEHMREWGSPRTPARLQKMAHCLAAFTRNAKRRSANDYAEAIADWEADLDYLYREYYVGHFAFAWPDAREPLLSYIARHHGTGERAPSGRIQRVL